MEHQVLLQLQEIMVVVEVDLEVQGLYLVVAVDLEHLRILLDQVLIELVVEAAVADQDVQVEDLLVLHQVLHLDQIQVLVMLLMLQPTQEVVLVVVECLLEQADLADQE
jgi:hypothetical protein